MRVSKCSKHVPMPYGGPLSQKVVCASCGRIGLPSNGRRMAGRPAKIIWLQERDLGMVPSDGFGRSWADSFGAPEDAISSQPGVTP